MIQNFKLTIEYDGSAYHGWQRQKNERTIQEEIEKALKTITGRNVKVTGSGRTDAGVHALGQVANFSCDTALSADIFHRGLNGLLQKDIVISACKTVSKDFHARYDAASKTYLYKILNRPTPAAVCRQYAWHIRTKLDPDAMRRALGYLMGTHDFKSFEGAGSPRSSTIRTVMKAELSKRDHGYLVVELTADGFLKFMVRNIVGTLADVGLGKMTPDDFNRIFQSKDRKLAGVTAPPHGLFLMRVDYRR